MTNREDNTPAAGSDLLKAVENTANLSQALAMYAEFGGTAISQADAKMVAADLRATGDR